MNSVISSDFYCHNCHFYNSSSPLGTKQRNHCSQCLYSLHLDKAADGDRLSLCKASMPPIALYAKVDNNKYVTSQNNIGEIKIIHQCFKCSTISSNRIAGDDQEEAILNLLKHEIKHDLKQFQKYHILNIDNYHLVLKQLRGESN